MVLNLHSGYVILYTVCACPTSSGVCVCPLRFLPPLNDSSNWRYLRLQCDTGSLLKKGVFSESASFKSYGVICLLQQSPPFLLRFSDDRHVYELLEAARLTIIAVYLPVSLVHKISRFANFRAARAQSERLNYTEFGKNYLLSDSRNCKKDKSR